MPDELHVLGKSTHMAVMICGAHMSGLPLNKQLLERGAWQVSTTRTAPIYRFYALPGDPPLRPGLVQVAENGMAIDVEVWRMPVGHFGSFVADARSLVSPRSAASRHALRAVQSRQFLAATELARLRLTNARRISATNHNEGTSMFHLPRSLRLLAVSLLASLIPIGAARADHFKFIVDFTSGPLNGSVYIGYFATSDPIGDFTPDAAYGNQLLSMSITIDGAKFIMQDDVDFPHFPRIRINSAPNSEGFDFIARGSPTAPHDKWLEIRLQGTNNVNFGTVRGGKVVVESFGYIYDIFRIDPREVPPEPQCGLCHSRLQR